MTALAKTNPVVVINNKGIALLFIVKWTFISVVLVRAIFGLTQVAFNQIAAVNILFNSCNINHARWAFTKTFDHTPFRDAREMEE